MGSRREFRSNQINVLRRCKTRRIWLEAPPTDFFRSLLVLLSHKIRARVFIWIATARCSILAYLHPDRGAGMDGGSSKGSEARFAGYVEARCRMIFQTARRCSATLCDLRVRALIAILTHSV